MTLSPPTPRRGMIRALLEDSRQRLMSDATDEQKQQVKLRATGLLTQACDHDANQALCAILEEAVLLLEEKTRLSAALKKFHNHLSESPQLARVLSKSFLILQLVA